MALHYYNIVERFTYRKNESFGEYYKMYTDTA